MLQNPCVLKECENLPSAAWYPWEMSKQDNIVLMNQLAKLLTKVKNQVVILNRQLLFSLKQKDVHFLLKKITLHYRDSVWALLSGRTENTQGHAEWVSPHSDVTLLRSIIGYHPTYIYSHKFATVNFVPSIWKGCWKIAVKKAVMARD